MTRKCTPNSAVVPRTLPSLAVRAYIEKKLPFVLEIAILAIEVVIVSLLIMCSGDVQCSRIGGSCITLFRSKFRLDGRPRN